MSLIEFHGVKKRFGRRRVLDGLDFAVNEGEFVGYIGENGAGKTTTVRLIMGMIHPGGGDIAVMGKDASLDIAARRGRIGYASETVSPPRHFTVKDALAFHRGFADQWDEAYAKSLFDRFDLDPSARLSNLSRGQLARVKIIMALATRPKLLILDEITAGLDALFRYQLGAILTEVVKKEETTVFFATNLLHEIDALATRVILLHEGKVHIDSSADSIKNRFLELGPASRAGLDFLPPGLILDRRLTGRGEFAVIRAGDREKISSLFPAIPVSPPDLETAFVLLLGEMKKGGRP